VNFGLDVLVVIQLMSLYLLIFTDLTTLSSFLSEWDKYGLWETLTQEQPVFLFFIKFTGFNLGSPHVVMLI